MNSIVSNHLTRKSYSAISSTMSSVRLLAAALLSLCVMCTLAVPPRPVSNDVSSGAGEITDELQPDDRPFDGPLGKGYPHDEVFNNYDLDSEKGPQLLPEDVNNIPQDRPQDGVSERRPDGRIPEEMHPDDEPEEELHEPPPQANSKGDAEMHDDEEETRVDEDEIHGTEEEDSHAVEDEKKLHVDEEEEKKMNLPLKPSLFSFQQVNHYIKQLEKAMDHVFKDSLEEAALMNNSFVNTTEEDVEVNGHKYKVEKSIIKTGDKDTNSTLFVEAISSINEDEPKNRSERSNPDAEPIQ